MKFRKLCKVYGLFFLFFFFFFLFNLNILFCNLSLLFLVLYRVNMEGSSFFPLYGQQDRFVKGDKGGAVKYCITTSCVAKNDIHESSFWTAMQRLPEMDAGRIKMAVADTADPQLAAEKHCLQSGHSSLLSHSSTSLSLRCKRKKGAAEKMEIIWKLKWNHGRWWPLKIFPSLFVIYRSKDVLGIKFTLKSHLSWAVDAYFLFQAMVLLS